MRITTNSIMRNYNNSLANSLTSLANARETVETEMRFSRAAQDPAAANKASRLTRTYLKMDTYIDNVEDTMKRQDAAEDSLQEIVSMTQEAMESDSLKAINGTTSETDRLIYATTLREYQSSLLKFANTTYINEYVFAGADGANPAFTMQDDGSITYRGQDVSGTYDFTDLKNEKLYIDVGLGLATTTNAPATSSNDYTDASAFNRSISGIEIFGSGSTDDGISKNLFALLGQMADELESDSFSTDRFSDMRTQLSENFNKLVDAEAMMGIKTQTLEATKTRLEDQKLNLYKQLETTAHVDSAKAITDMTYAQYSYNKLLQAGSSLLSNSLLDFLS